MSDHEDRDEIFAEVAIKKGLLTPEKVREARDAQRKLREVGLERTLWQICEERGTLRPEEVVNLKRAMVREGGARVRIAGYEIVERIGSGAMGQVFRATQLSVHRVVALKILSAGVARDPKYVERFTREARLAARLNHPNVVRVFNFGEDHGRRYLAMEFVEGESVAQTIARDGPLPIDRAIEIAIQAARGLRHAHEQGVIHRDIKPSNLLIDAGGVLKVADLGLARQAGEDAPITQVSGFVGTPAYVAPEQVQTQQSDARSDIYSLGATLFQMLTGEPPYTGVTAYDVVSRHVAHPPPSARQARQEVSEALDAVIVRMMAKRPEHRYRSMEEVAKDLEAVRRGETPMAVAERKRLRRGPRRRTRMAAALVAAAGTFLLVVGILSRVSGPDMPGGAVPGSATALGEIWDADRDLPLAGAAVSAGPDGPKTFTNARGRFELDLPRLGEHILLVERDGYRPGRIRLHARRSAHWTGSFALHPDRPESRTIRRDLRLRPGDSARLAGEGTSSPDITLVSHAPDRGTAEFQAAAGILVAGRAPLDYYEHAPPSGYREGPERVEEGQVFFVRTRAGLYAKCRLLASRGVQETLVRSVAQANGTRAFARGPANFSAVWRPGRIDLRWEEVPQALRYVVWRGEGGEPYREIATTLLPEYSDAGIRPDAIYHYGVSAVLDDGGETDLAERRALAGPAGLRFHDLVFGDESARLDLFLARIDDAGYDLLMVPEEPGWLRLYTPLAGGVVRAVATDGGLQLAPAEGYVCEDLRAQAGDRVWVRTPGGRFARVHFRRVPPQGLAVEYVVQPDGGRWFPPGPAGLRATRKDREIRLTWEATDAVSDAIYRVRSRPVGEPWSVVASGPETEWSGPAPASAGEYEYAVSASDKNGRHETDRSVVRVKAP